MCRFTVISPVHLIQKIGVDPGNRVGRFRFDAHHANTGAGTSTFHLSDCGRCRVVQGIRGAIELQIGNAVPRVELDAASIPLLGCLANFHSCSGQPSAIDGSSLSIL